MKEIRLVVVLILLTLLALGVVVFTSRSSTVYANITQGAAWCRDSDGGLTPETRGLVARLPPAPVQVSETPDYYQLSNGQLGVRSYKGSAGYNTYWTPDFQEVLLYSERVVVEYQETNGKWKQWGTPTQTRLQKLKEGYQVVRDYTDYQGSNYTVTYLLRPGQGVKLTLELHSADARTFRVAWQLDGLTGDQTSHKTADQELLYYDERQEKYQLKVSYQDVHQAFGEVTSLSEETTAQGRKHLLTFGPFEVRSGEKFLLDPLISTSGYEDSVVGVHGSSLGRFSDGELVVFLKGTNGTLQSYAVNSTDGSSWTQYSAHESSYISYPNLLIDSSDSVYAFGTSGSDTIDMLNSTQGSLDTWNFTANVSYYDAGFSGSLLGPPVTITSSDNIYLAQGYNKSYLLVSNSTTGGESWTRNFVTNSSPLDCWTAYLPVDKLHLTADETDTVHLVYGCADVNDEFYLYYVNNSGGSWHESVEVVPGEADYSLSYEFKLVPDFSNTLYLFYSHNATKDRVAFYKSTDGGASWTGPLNVTPSDKDAHWVDYTVTEDYLIAFYSEASGSELYVTYSNDSGTSWSTPVTSLTTDTVNRINTRWRLNPAGRNSTNISATGNNSLNFLYLNSTYDVYYDYHYLDTTYPQSSSVATNTTEVGYLCEFSVKWEDDNGLSGYIFSSNNTGIWSNDTFTSWAGTPTEDWSNVTKNLNTTVGLAVGWKVYVNDTSKNWKTSSSTLTTTDSQLPTYSNAADDAGATEEKGTQVNTSAQWSDNNALAYYWLARNETGAWVNQTASSFSTGNWSNVSFSTQAADFEVGELVGWKLYANDTGGNENTTTAFTWTVSDNTTPTFTGAHQNLTNTSTLWKGEVVGVGGRWNDAVALSRYWLENSTNGTLQTFSTGNWSNYTWRTASLTPGSTYTLRLFANDTSNNEAKGGVWSYTVDGTAPTWSSVGSSETNESSVSGEVNTSAQWSDNVELSHYWFYNGTENETALTFSTGNWSNVTWDSSGLSGNQTLKLYANDSSGTEVQGPVWVFQVSGYIWTPENPHLNTTYISFNQSAILCVNASVNATHTPSNATVEVQLSNGSYLNYTLTQLGNATYHYNFTNADLGYSNSEAGLLNLTKFCAANSTTILCTTTSLTLDYARSTQLLEDHPDPASTSDTLYITADYETTESTDLEGNCSVSLYHLNGSTLFSELSYSTNHSTAYSLTGWDLGGYEYNVSCENLSYESRWATGSFELVDSGGDEGGGGGGTPPGGECLEHADCAEGLYCLDSECREPALNDGVCQRELETGCQGDCLGLFTLPAGLRRSVLPGETLTFELPVALRGEVTEDQNATLLLHKLEDASYRWADLDPSTFSFTGTVYSTLRVEIPENADPGDYEFTVRVYDSQNRCNELPVRLEVYSSLGWWSLVENWLQQEHQLDFADGRYFYLPPVFQGSYLSVKPLYGVLLVLILLILGVLAKILTFLFGGSGKREST